MRSLTLPALPRFKHFQRVLRASSPAGRTLQAQQWLSGVVGNRKTEILGQGDTQTGLGTRVPSALGFSTDLFYSPTVSVPPGAPPVPVCLTCLLSLPCWGPPQIQGGPWGPLSETPHRAWGKEPLVVHMGQAFGTRLSPGDSGHKTHLAFPLGGLCSFLVWPLFALSFLGNLLWGRLQLVSLS